jgi:hypothetical protein
MSKMRKFEKRWTKDAILKEVEKMEIGAAERFVSRLGHVFIADGFVKEPWPKFAKMGIEKGEFPVGCWCTFWFTARSEDEIDVGVPLFFDPHHTCKSARGVVSNGYDARAMKEARIGTALQEAEGLMLALEEYRNSGVINALLN